MLISIRKYLFYTVLIVMLGLPGLGYAQSYNPEICKDEVMGDTLGQSWVARFIESGMRSANVKEGGRLSDYINNRTKEVPARPLTRMYLRYDIDVDDTYGHNVWTIEPLKDMSDKVILYLHGGSYKYNFVAAHWHFISHVIDELNVSVVAVDYPLAPEYNVTHVFDLLMKVYKDMLKKHDAKDIIIMGDSAGGGMSLALGQHLKKNKYPQPEQLILLSPCVDVTLENPKIIEFDKSDPILNIKSIIQAGYEYAGPMDRKHYLVSPIFGELKGLAPISLYVGTHDLLVADCRKLNCMAENLGVNFKYHEYEGLFHVGMLYPTPEGNEIRKEIIEEIKN